MVIKRKSLPSRASSSVLTTPSQNPALPEAPVHQGATTMNVPPVPHGLSRSLNRRHPSDNIVPARDLDSDSDWDASDEERKQLKKSGALQIKRRSPQAILPNIAFTDAEQPYTGMDQFEANFSSQANDPPPLLPPRSPKRASFAGGETTQPIEHPGVAELSGLESSASVWDAAGQATPSVSSSNVIANTFEGTATTEATYTTQPKALKQPSSPAPPLLPPPPPPVSNTANSQSIWEEEPTRQPSIITADNRYEPKPPQASEASNPWDEAGASWASRRAAAESTKSRPPVYEKEDGTQPLPIISTLSIDPPPNPDWATEPSQLPNPSKAQRNEVYQVKHIRYGHDMSEAFRSWPILVQNANGPCPLLALVNALVLSTPAATITGLIGTLRTRDNVTLGLLLDAVVDELMSRGSEPDAILPDVGDLYEFLVNLHTGMNVNPRFIALSGGFSEGAGDFEDTREMQLYGTFHIPLIHGWLPEVQSEAYMAFERSAQSYEDAQNLLLREEELEQKIQSEDLSIEEQTLYMDTTMIKGFLSEWSSQLTETGLERIRSTMQLGTFAILFRNDHFSVLYKEPRTSQLMALVTDAGYLTHDEIIWESLVDVNGVNSEYYSGDFRSVSHAENEQAVDYEGQGWTTVESKKPRSRPADVAPSAASAPFSDPTDPETAALLKRLAADQEQADRDFAMALQLQDEEEERNRTDLAARERENQLSEQFVASETNRQPQQGPASPTQPPPQPPRPAAALATRRPPVVTRSEEDGAPPPYEHATASPPYSPQPQQQQQQQQHQYQAGSGPSMSPAGRRRLSSRQSYLMQGAPPQPPRPPNHNIANDGSAASKDEDKCSMM